MPLSADVQSSPPATADAAGRMLWAVYRSALDRFAPLRDGLVARSLIPNDTGGELTEPSPLNTAEVVRALFLLEANGRPHAWDARALLRRLVSDPSCRKDVQVAALTLWAAAVGRDPLADEAYAACRAQLDGCSQSMTLGWALCGLCEYARMNGRRDEARRVATHLLTRLAANQNPRSALFHASGRREGLLRRRVCDTTLSSQTYPILGIATYSQVFGDTGCLAMADRCASVICAQQGPQGQWWWRYDAGSGRVTSRYPVYCVNQDSAVPGALGALQRAFGDSRYRAAIARGVAWELGTNEMGRTLIEADAGIIARAVEETSQGFVVNHELYSYQPARFIFAALNDPTAAVRR